MITVLYQFPKSVDQQALDEFLTTSLLPGIKQAEGLQSLQMNADNLMSAGGPPPFSMVVQASLLHWRLCSDMYSRHQGSLRKSSWKVLIL